MRPQYHARALAWVAEMQAGMTQVSIARREGLAHSTVSKAVKAIDPKIVFHSRRNILLPKHTASPQPNWSVPDAVTLAECHAGRAEIAAALAGRDGVVMP